MANGNISAGQVKSSINSWICSSPIAKAILTNPIAISILIMTIIFLLDVLYGKNFENTSTREVLQHSTTVFFVMMAGIFLNNTAILQCGKVGGRQDPIEFEREPPTEQTVAVPQPNYDELLSQYR